MSKINKRAAPSPKNAASKINGLESTTPPLWGTSRAGRFGPNVGRLIALALALAGIGGGL